MANVSFYIAMHVWELATKVDGYDPDIWRKDFAGAWLRKDSYGMHTKYGWEVDHLRPLSKGGTNDLSNLTALHWQNDQTKGANWPEFKTSLTADGNRNIEKVRSWRHQ
ncbi:MAG: HNH endonuclease signature motif containing protein [Prevotella sp.]|nr:HNH endonuclease signature motif containing protein [Prevotella sp.]